MSIKGGILDSVRGVRTEKHESPWEEALRLSKEAEEAAATKKTERRFQGLDIEEKPEEVEVRAEEDWFLDELNSL